MSAPGHGPSAEAADGVLLGGGRTTAGVVRIGDTVHRPVRPWTPAVHAVLRYLEEAGLAGAPRVLGFDDQGREVLTFLEGETVGELLPWPAWVHADATLLEVGTWLRRLHDLTAHFRPPADATWSSGRPWRPGLVIGHHDVAPYNAVWRDGELVGFVDWDTAGPSSRELDLAYAALLWVPLLAPGGGWPHASIPVGDRSRRLHLLLDAYGFDGDRKDFGAVVAARARINAAVIHRLAAGGEPRYVALRRQAEQLERSACEVEARPAASWRRPETG
ncbi:phosphotransferase [Geodermatophilus sabuli]|uniref:phosphotransferase n=1 Tax=Geodermatophilus sabuli TaxID=1564158 RepID=UPI0031F33029